MRKIAFIGLIVLAASLAFTAFHITSRTNSKLGASDDRRATELFTAWKTASKKLYASAKEHEYRKGIFAANLKKVESHNAQKGVSYTMKLNDFADLTEQEFRAKLTFKSEVLSRQNSASLKSGLSQQPNFDWRQYLQQQSITAGVACNDNYAWVAAVTMNANFYIKQATPNVYSFSPQTYIDCSGNFGNYGCNGGNAFSSFNYSRSWGIDTLQDYPYTGYQKACRAALGYFKNSGIYVVPQYSNTDLYNQLASKNLIAVAIDISSAQFYQGGVFSGPCTTTVNHQLILLGAGNDVPSGKDYWLLLNTWGASWGENGYMRLQRFSIDGNPMYSSCGLNMFANFPTF